MSHITADMVAKVRRDDVASSAHRRRNAQQLRVARERLTSTGSVQRTFVAEFLRSYAERQPKAVLSQALLALCSAALLMAWVPLALVGIWLSLVLIAAVIVIRVARRFDHADGVSPQYRPWRQRFALASLAQSMAWSSIVGAEAWAGTPGLQTSLLLILLVNSGVAAIFGSDVRIAVYAALVPTTLAAVALLAPGASLATVPQALLVACVQAFCLVIAHRVHAIALANVTAQAERDASIVELEQARLNSDEARRRAEDANLAKSRFLATMSHELRTPLNAILGFSEVMKSELFGPHAIPLYREYSNDVHSSGQHLLTLINEILDLSRVEAGRYELREEPVNLTHIVQDCRHLLTLRASKRQISIQESIQRELPRVWADERAMRQVVLNLLSNAIKFTPQDGVVTITLGATTENGQFVSIKDTGPGIPEAEIPTVMSSFGRGSLAQKNAEEGSGLGLPIVKGLVEMHGGTFTLESKVREGTEVTVILPPERVIDALPQLAVDTVDQPPPPPRRRPSARSAA